MLALTDVSLTLPSGASVLGSVSLDIPTGKTTALLGRSGSGKTTILRLLNAMTLPTGGRVTVDGRDTAAWNPIELRRRTGYVMQSAGLLPHYTVARNVSLVPSLLGHADTDARVCELLALVGLDVDTYADRYPHQLSGGQQQRVGIARALAADPPVLLCDEPFGALDPITRAELQRAFAHLGRTVNKTIVFVTHDVREALIVGDHIALLADGKVVVSGTAEAFMTSEHAEAAAFRDSVSMPS